jgi:co-chaperonin GroES (HSP10)
MINKVTGKLVPIRDNILITDMEFGETQTKGGLVLLSDDGKAEGVKHRWGRVWAIGPQQKEVKVGEWILLEHGRWTRGVTVVEADGTEIIIRRADLKAILAVAGEKPAEDLFGKHSTVTHATVDPSTFMSRSFEH